jgi:hypothetical protein
MIHDFIYARINCTFAHKPFAYDVSTAFVTGCFQPFATEQLLYCNAANELPRSKLRGIKSFSKLKRLFAASCGELTLNEIKYPDMVHT